MRTEVKIASIIVLIVVALGAVWFVAFRSKGSGGPGDGSGGEAVVVRTGGEDETNRVETRAPSSDEPGDRSVLGGEEDAADSTDASDGTVIIGLASDSTDAADSADTSDDSTASDADAVGRYPSRVVGTDLPPDRGPTGYESVASSTPATYVVKDGDNYWLIAKSVYGDASLYGLLVKANPNLSARSLRKGMTIKVPAKPARTASRTTGAVAAARHGKTERDALTGKRYYIVKKGDNGFWGVSKAVFGSGKHWKQVEALNAGVDAGRLQPGQKIQVPETVASVASVAPAPSRTDSTSGSVGTASVGSTTVRVRTGAPARTVMASGVVFD